MDHLLSGKRQSTLQEGLNVLQNLIHGVTVLAADQRMGKHPALRTAQHMGRVASRRMNPAAMTAAKHRNLRTEGLGKC